MILVFDFETTGLTLHPDAPNAKQPKAIEFGCALLNSHNGKIEIEASMKINPQESLSDEIIKITGLTDADLVRALTFAQVEPQLRGLFKQAIGMIAHNLPFDRAILLHELARNNITDFPWPKRQLCTVGLYAWHW